MRYNSLVLLSLGLYLPANAQDPWPMEHYDRWGTNRAPSGPETLTKGWLHAIVGNNNVVGNGPALAADGIGYYGCWQNNRIFKFDSHTGATLNSFQAQGFVESTPSLAGDQIYVAASRVYAIDRSSFDYNWFYTIGQSHCSTITGPDLDMMMTGGNVNRFNKTTGEVVWSRSGLGPATHTVAFSRDDTAVFASHGNRISAFRYLDGETIWSVDLGSTMGAPGVAENGTVVIGSAAGTIYALNPSTGAVLWTRALLAGSLTSPAFGTNGTVYVTSADSRLYALRLSDGVRLWSFTSSGQALAAPAVGHDGMIYFCNYGGDLYKVSPLGALQWQLRLVGQSRGPMSIGADGTLYVPTWNDISTGGLAIVRQLPAVLSPDSFQYFDGTVFAGSLADLLESDDSYFTSHSGNIAGSVDVALITYSPIRVPTKIEIDFEAAALRLGLSLRVSMLKYASNTYSTLGGFVAPTADASRTFILTSTASQHLRSGDGQTALRLTWRPINDEDPAQDGWNTNVDLVRLTITP